MARNARLRLGRAGRSARTARSLDFAGLIAPKKRSSTGIRRGQAPRSAAPESPFDHEDRASLPARFGIVADKRNDHLGAETDCGCPQPSRFVLQGRRYPWADE